MTPDWNPELADEVWKELRSRASSPRPRVPSSGSPSPKPSQRPRAWTRKSRLLASGAALFVSIVLMSVRAIIRGDLPLVGGSALVCSLLGILLLDQTLPGPTRAPSTFLQRPIALTRGPRRGLLAALAIGTLLVLTGLAESFLHMGEDFRAPVVKCATHALLTGSIALACLLWIWRRTDPFSPLLTGALLGASSGVIGSLAVTFVCVNREGFHLLLGHGLTTTVLAIVGAWFGRRWLTP